MVIPSNTNINTQTGSTTKAKVDHKAVELNSPEKQTQEKSSPANGGASKDSVSLSSTALTIANLEAKVSGSSSIDRAKIDEIKASISEGTYRADADKIALAILKQEELLN